MKNIIKLVSGIAFALLVVVAGVPSSARAETNATVAPIKVDNPATISGIKIRMIRHTSADIMWQTNELTKGGLVYFSTVSGFNPQSADSNALFIKERSDVYHNGHRTGFATLTPDTTYYYVIKVTDRGGNVTWSDQGSFKTIPLGKKDHKAPIISNLSISPATDDSVIIKWDTNEWTTGILWYSTTDPTPKYAQPIHHSSYAKHHEFKVTGLTKGTTYYFVATSADKAGNMSADSRGSFTTTSSNTTDTTAPVLSNLSVATNTTAKTAVITWKTNENADSKIMWSTNIAFPDNDSTKAMGDANMTMDHSLTLSNLNTNTIYYFKTQSKDQSGNVGTSVIGSLFLAI